ncbi:MAG TPA: hypothetical protein VF884_12505 [Nitrososphaeraceae archaeon]
MNYSSKYILFLVLGVALLTSLSAANAFAVKDPFASKQVKNNCRSGDVLKGAENKKDLKLISKCESARGIVHHVKKHMKDGDYKFQLDVQKKYNGLLNKGNKKKTNGNLIVEVVPKDRKSSQVDLPSGGDDVRVWGAWVKDKPKGWNEIHPAWKVAQK